MPELRLSPSGAPLGSVTPGFQLRLNENQSSQTVALLDTQVYTPLRNTLNQDIVAALPTPNAAKRYKVNAHFEVENSSTDTPTSLTTRLEVSYDGQATWQPVALRVNQHQLAPLAKNVKTIDLAMTLGSSLLAPVPDPAPAEIAVRLACVAGDVGTLRTTNGGQNGTAWISLAELA